MERLENSRSNFTLQTQWSPQPPWGTLSPALPVCLAPPRPCPGGLPSMVPSAQEPSTLRPVQGEVSPQMMQTRCLGVIPGCAIHKLRDLGPGL